MQESIYIFHSNCEYWYDLVEKDKENNGVVFRPDSVMCIKYIFETLKVCRWMGVKKIGFDLSLFEENIRKSFIREIKDKKMFFDDLVKIQIEGENSNEKN